MAMIRHALRVGLVVVFASGCGAGSDPATAAVPELEDGVLGVSSYTGPNGGSADTSKMGFFNNLASYEAFCEIDRRDAALLNEPVFRAQHQGNGKAGHVGPYGEPLFLGYQGGPDPARPIRPEKGRFGISLWYDDGAGPVQATLFRSTDSTVPGTPVYQLTRTFLFVVETQGDVFGVRAHCTAYSPASVQNNDPPSYTWISVLQ